MSSSLTSNPSWMQVLKKWLHPQVIVMGLLGFSAGLPILLIFGTLSVWLSEAGIAKSTVTFFSWAALGYSFKFVWAPIIDKLPFPYLSRLMGRRRSWLLVSQCMVIFAIVCMGSVNPVGGELNLTLMALFAVLLGFSSATQDIVIDAYRIECLEEDYQALLASTYIAGYRIGMVVAGAGALFLASYFGSTEEVYLFSAWRKTYWLMAATMLLGVITTLIITEPERNVASNVYSYSTEQYLRLFFVFLTCCVVFCAIFFLSSDLVTRLKNYFVDTLSIQAHVIKFVIETLRLICAIICCALVALGLVKAKAIEKRVVKETYVEPIVDFFSRYGWSTAILLLLLIGFYRVSDIVLGVISNVFYLDMGYSKNAIAAISKLYGLGMTIIGGFLGGFLTLRYGVYSILFLGAFLSSVTNLFFMILAGSEPNLTLLTAVIAIDNLSAGLAATAFVAFLSSLTNISFTAVQYALFSSLMTLFPKVLGGYSGSFVTEFDYNTFFLMTCLLGIPVLALIWIAKRKLE